MGSKSRIGTQQPAVLIITPPPQSTQLHEPRTTIQEIALSNYNQVIQKGLTSETIT